MHHIQAIFQKIMGLWLGKVKDESSFFNGHIFIANEIFF